MSYSNSGKIPTKLYLIVNKCENLSDLRSENEKKKEKDPMWRVIFTDAKESLATEFVQGLSLVCWMCEFFLTVKDSSNSFSLVVLDGNSRIAGKATINFSDIPIGDKNLLKPGRPNEGAREASRNLLPCQKMTINSSNSTISFWVWALEFKVFKEPGSSLKRRLKSFSTSFTSNLKDCIQNNFSTTNTNPFLSDFNDGKKDETKNPFEEDIEFQNKFGNSQFQSVEHAKFRPSIWIPKEKYTTDLNPFLNIPRASSLPDIDKISQDLNFQNLSETLEQFKQTLLENQSPLSVSEIDLTNFTKLSQLYSCRKADNMEGTTDEQFFAVLNNMQREYADNMIQMHSLEEHNKELIEELDELRSHLYSLKTKLIANNLSDFLQNL